MIIYFKTNEIMHIIAILYKLFPIEEKCFKKRLLVTLHVS